ncbi:MAG: hypothetical protein AVDCRST_MAG95-1924 [uncultured Adhaeribacter sp.]|uniref:Uncharacterized protein n=1 Tax=uncultured Adhaeribacter sp. TaxID=448109 RepID=A0A6J4IH48_9BACT|nr:MAG: hypothetical protein AVDCRST_MAG95-1924 [uncultured Adhaeribacter sp.]
MQRVFNIRIFWVRVEIIYAFPLQLQIQLPFRYSANPVTADSPLF